MRISYYSDTDSLYIDLSSKPSVDSREVSDGIVLDYALAASLAVVFRSSIGTYSRVGAPKYTCRGRAIF